MMNRGVMFLTGAGAGAVVALLFAPQSGKTTQRVINKNVQKGLNKAATMSNKVKSQAVDLMDKGQNLVEGAKTLVESSKDRMAQAIAVGREAYEEKKAAAS